jgi:N-acetylglucosamine-6-sulfatase
MRKIIALLASVASAVGLLFFGAYARTTDDMSKARAQSITARPNIVFILTDDMRKDDLKYMPKTHSLIREQGMGFRNAFVSHALCCPSRASIMRGQYAHNTGVWSNSPTDSPSTTNGGWQAYQANGNEIDNMATRLHSAGYRTALFGKYLNGYNTTEIPPGWDRWFAHTNGIDYYDYQINDDGTIKHYDSTSADYETDVVAKHARTFIGNSAEADVPFFAYVAPKAPHFPAIPAPRHLHAYDGLRAPRPTSFNEKDVSDKVSWIRKLPRLSAANEAKIDNQHERRAESLQAVDDLVAGVVGTLRDKGVLSSTYIFFTSDNGWHEGEHRIPKEKWRPYEENIHTPLWVRGPGVAAGSTTYKLTLNTDYLPTFTNLAGVQTPPYVDGRSLKPVLDGSLTSWRNAVLLEAAANYSPAYRGIRTVNTNTTRLYVQYSGPARELYNLETDSFELNNAYDAAAPPASLAIRLQALEVCAADTCRTAEDGPKQFEEVQE